MSPGLLNRVALVRTDASEEHIPSMFMVMKAICNSETSVRNRATRRNFPEDTHYCYRREDIPEGSVLRPYTLARSSKFR
jgi:hypothetical protein